MTAHEYKHYYNGGTGLRSLLDTYVFLKNRPLDMAYVAEEAKKIDILDFERKNRRLALRLFDGEELTAEEREMLRYIYSSGTYGTEENALNNQIARKGRWRYLLSRIFPSVDDLLWLFPFLKKLPFLYPFCWVLRMFWGLLFYRKQMKNQIKAALGLKKENDE